MGNILQAFPKGSGNSKSSDVDIQFIEGGIKTLSPVKTTYLQPISNIYGCCSSESNYTQKAINDDANLKLSVCEINTPNYEYADVMGIWPVANRIDMNSTQTLRGSSERPSTYTQYTLTQDIDVSTLGTYIDRDDPTILASLPYGTLILDFNTVSSSYVYYGSSYPTKLYVSFGGEDQKKLVGTYTSSSQFSNKNYKIYIPITNAAANKMLSGPVTFYIEYYRSSSYSYQSSINIKLNNINFYKTKTSDLATASQITALETFISTGNKFDLYDISVTGIDMKGIKVLDENCDYNVSDDTNNYLCDIYDLNKNTLMEYVDLESYSATDETTIVYLSQGIKLLQSQFYFENMESIIYEVSRDSDGQITFTFDEPFTGTIYFAGPLLQPRYTKYNESKVSYNIITDVLEPGKQYEIKSNLLLETLVPNSVYGTLVTKSFYSTSKNNRDIRGLLAGRFYLGNSDTSYSDLVSATEEFGKNYTTVKDLLYTKLPHNNKQQNEYNVNDMTVNSDLANVLTVRGLNQLTPNALSRMGSKLTLYNYSSTSRVFRGMYRTPYSDYLYITDNTRLRVSYDYNSSDLCYYYIETELRSVVDGEDVWTSVTKKTIVTDTATVSYSLTVSYLGDGVGTYQYSGYNTSTYIYGATTENTFIVNPTTAVLTVGTAYTLAAAGSATVSYMYDTIRSLYEPLAITYVFTKQNYVNAGEYGYQNSSNVYTYRSYIYYPFTTSYSNLHSNGDGSIGTDYLGYINSSGDWVYPWIGKTCTWTLSNYNIWTNNNYYQLSSIDTSGSKYRLIFKYSSNCNFDSAIYYEAHTYSSGTYDTSYQTAIKHYVLTNSCNNKNVPYSIQTYGETYASATADPVVTVDVPYLPRASTLFTGNEISDRYVGVLYIDNLYIILLPLKLDRVKNYYYYEINDIKDLLELKDAQFIQFNVTTKKYEPIGKYLSATDKKNIGSYLFNVNTHI